MNNWTSTKICSCVLFLAASMAYAELPSATAVRVSSPPRIDGKLNEPQWKNAPVLTGLTLAGSGLPATQQTSARILFDDRAIYFSFTNREDRMADAAANVAGRDAPLKSEDHLRIFLGPAHDRFNFYEFVIGLGGARFDASGDGAGVSADWDAAWQTAVSRGQDRWWAEVAIPFAALEIRGRASSVWDFNFCRVEQPHGEKSSWAPSGERFAAPGSFGTLRGLDVDFSRFSVTIGLGQSLAWGFGRNELKVRLNNLGKERRNIACRVQVVPPSEKPRTTRTPARWLAAGAKAEHDLAFQIFEPGAHRLVVEAIDAKTRSLVAATERNILLQAPVEYALFHSYYRDDVTVRARLNLSEKALPACRITATLFCSDGAEELARKEIVPRVRETVLVLPVPPGTTSKCRIQLQLRERGKVTHEQGLEFLPLRTQPVEQLQVHPREDLALLVDGKPFFPIGIYETPITEKMLDEFKHAGFNTVQMYGGPAAILKTGLDRIGRAGMMAWVALGHSLDFSTDAAKPPQRVTEAVRAVGNHPALLVWESLDEPAWGAQSLEGLLAGYQFLRKLDPNHPVWMNHAPRNRVGTLAAYNLATDIAGCDIYPVPEPTNHTNLPNRTLSSVGDETDKNRAALNYEKPVFMVLQGFAWRALQRRDDPKAVYPTFQQQRYMAYSAILHGAKGLLYWGTRYTPKPSKPWADLKTAVHELSRVMPLLTGRNAEVQPAVESDTGSVEVLLRQNQGRAYLLCINNENRPARARLSGLPKNLSPLRVLYESGKNLRATGGTAEFTLGAYGVLVATTDKEIKDTRPDYTEELAHPARAPRADQMKEPGNLALNPSFEFDTAGASLPDSWQCRYPFSARLSEQEPHSGKLCLRFNSADPKFMPLLVQTRIAVDAGRDYELSAWYRTDGGEIECRAYVEWVTNGQFHSRTIPFARGRAEWQRLERRFKTTPPIGKTLYLVVQTRGKGTAWFDDVRIRLVE